MTDVVFLVLCLFCRTSHKYISDTDLQGVNISNNKIFPQFGY